jgi:hypothetical protein
VASFCGSAARLSSQPPMPKPAGSRPSIRRNRSSPASLAASRSRHAACAPALRRPASRQAATISSGISNGSLSQTSCFLAAATSSSPKAAPCVAEVPCLLGAPQPMIVRQAISDGRGSASASSIARRISATSWPSQCATCQP